MKKHLSKKRVVLAAIVTVALALASGVAYAYWTSTGGGTASAGVGAGDLSKIVVTQDGTPSGLYPGGDAQPIAFTVLNNAGYQVNVKTVSVAFASTNPITGGSGLLPACATDDFTLANSPVSLSGTNGVTIAKNTSVPFTSPGVTLPTIAMKDTAANQDACKNVTVHLVLTAS